jgi:hypothetical protein
MIAGASVAIAQTASDTLGSGSSATTERIGQEWASVPVGGLTKEAELELYGTTRAVSPGGLVVIRYSVNSFEDQDERVRLRLYLPPGWTLLDRDIEGRELLLEAWENLEGEIRVAVPPDARPGDRHRIRVSGEIVGESGSMEVFSIVQVIRRGGLKPGDVGLTGTAAVQASNVAMADLTGTRYGGTADLSGKLRAGTTLALTYRQGPRENNLTNYRIAQEETRWNGTLRGGSWMMQFGNQINSYGGVLSGPSVRGQGATVRRTSGSLVGDLTVARPTNSFGDASGHLVRGMFGVSGSLGRISAAVSDFGRPVGGYSTAPRYPENIDPDSLEKLERERAALEQAPSNRVQGAGLDVEVRRGTVHRLNLRGGWLRLYNAHGDTLADPSAEAQYALTHRRVSVNARWRQMPASLQGIYLPGNEVSADGSVKIVGEWRLAGRAYRTLNETLGNGYRSEGEGAALGFRWYRGGWRLDARGSHREWSYGEGTTIARTATLSLGVPVGPLAFSGFADVGAQDNGIVRQPTASYRGDLRWSGRTGTASWSASYFETLSAPPRLRTDLLGSLRLGDWELAGGAWATRGMVAGGEPGLWTQVGVPVTYDVLISVGVEHAAPAYGQRPAWLGTMGIRKKLALAIPFINDGTALHNAASRSGPEAQRASPDAP